MKQSVLVIGLGRFGTAAARELMRLGHDVLAVDSDEAAVNEIAPEVTQALQLDAADLEALKGIGAGEFDHAIVAISGRANRACSRRWRSSSSASATSLPRPGPRSTVPSSNASARIASCSPSARWACASPTCSPTRT